MMMRPLPAAAPGQKTSSITRSHVLYDHSPDGASNLISLIGGKITTYRQVGEEVVDRAFQRRQQTVPKCETRTRSLPGAILPNDDRIKQAIAQYGDRLDLSTIDHLFGIYGARAIDLLKLIDETPELGKSLTPDQPSILAQIVFAVRSEYAETLIDILHRRTMLAMQSDYGFGILPIVTAVLQQHCDWTVAQSDREIAAYKQFMRDNCIPDFVGDRV
jgi:glycerol-3-phosphate dehydrogenase